MAEFKEPELVQIIHERSEQMKFYMIEVPKGSFFMGSNDYNDEKPIHKVDIDYIFEIGKYPVTIREYIEFIKDTETHYPIWLEKDSEYNIQKGHNNYYKNMNLTANAPIIGISWYDAMAYCKWLSQKANRIYRLPTEAEWEYACRAETTTKWYFGDHETELDKYSWYSKNSEKTTHNVGQKRPNRWGICDMHGNVWEWCLDDWKNNYEDIPLDGSAYIDKNSFKKVLRGGSWNDIENYTSSSIRYGYFPKAKNNIFGFRIVTDKKSV